MDDPRTILQQVAAGTLTPEEAARLLEKAPAAEVASGASNEAPEAPGAPPPTPRDDPEDQTEVQPVFADAVVETLRVTGAFRSATIVADPTVTTATVEGSHTARIDGTTLVIDGDDNAVEGFHFETGRGRRRRSVHIGVDNPRPTPLKIRCNPELNLEAVMAAGTCKIHGMRGHVSAEVSAGALSLDDVTGPLDLTTAAGPIKVRGKIATGQSRIRCEAGAVKVVLEQGSDVRITASAALGKVVLPGGIAPSGFSVGSAAAEAVIGNGTATLAIECALGAVKVVHAADDNGEDAIQRSATVVKQHMGWR